MTIWRLSVYTHFVASAASVSNAHSQPDFIPRIALDTVLLMLKFDCQLRHLLMSNSYRAAAAWWCLTLTFFSRIHSKQVNSKRHRSYTQFLNIFVANIVYFNTANSLAQLRFWMYVCPDLNHVRTYHYRFTQWLVILHALNINELNPKTMSVWLTFMVSQNPQNHRNVETNKRRSPLADCLLGPCCILRIVYWI